jgi:hypothetical protein
MNEILITFFNYYSKVMQVTKLQNAPRDASKLQQIIKAKERENNEEARHIEDTQRLVTEIEMLKVVFYLVNRNSSASAPNY